ncbi:MAG TPA: hypothetical protein DCX12_01130 [Chloroflexi bacterium]|jgi:hypothetical protein|nr:hypothetical protein [Chloroflexota bacterium]
MSFAAIILQPANDWRPEDLGQYEYNGDAARRATFRAGGLRDCAAVVIDLEPGPADEFTSSADPLRGTFIQTKGWLPADLLHRIGVAACKLRRGEALG